MTPEGQAYQQIEAVGIVAGTGVPELAHRFVDYVLSEEVQSLIPTTNWMFPVNAETPLPEFFAEYAVVPENPVRLDAAAHRGKRAALAARVGAAHHGPAVMTRRASGQAAGAAPAGCSLLLPAAALLIFVFYLPVGTALLEGFREEPGSSAYSLRRFIELLTDPYILGLLRFTAWQAFLSAALSVVIGVPLGYLLANRSFPGKSLVSSLMMVPFVMPAITVALGFLLMYGVNGWFNEALDALFGVKVRVLHTLWAIVLAHAFYNGAAGGPHDAGRVGAARPGSGGKRPHAWARGRSPYSGT